MVVVAERRQVAVQRSVTISGELVPVACVGVRR
jgi:hypothetical protein